MKGILLVAASAVCLSAGSALASCYGTGYARTCNGYGGPGATYSPRGGSGSTTYYNNGGLSRQSTYTTTNYGSGYIRQTNTRYYGN